MLNDEGWSLLLFLVLFISVLLIGLKKLKSDVSLSERLTLSEGYFSRNTGIYLRLCGSTLLCVIPGLLYRNGIWAGLSVLSILCGAFFLLLFLLPRLPSGEGLTLSGTLALSSRAQVCFSILSLLPTFVLTAAALILSARFVSGVFSLHYVISLAGVCVASLVLCMFKNGESRALSDCFSAFLPIIVLAALSAYLIAVKEEHLLPFVEDALSAPVTVEGSLIPVLSAACMGLGIPGLLLPIQRSLSSDKKQKKKSTLAYLLFSVCLLLSGFSGFFGSLVDASLSDVPASETILLQLTSWAVIPAPIRGALSASLILLPLLYVADALKTMSTVLIADVRKPAPEKTLLLSARLCVPFLALLLFLLALPEKVPLMTYVSFALLLSSPIGIVLLMTALGKKYSDKTLCFALLFGESLSVCGFVCSLFLWDLGCIPAFPAALSTLLILLIGGNVHGKK